VARPLREQFAFASFLILVPVAVVMTYATTVAVWGELDQVNEEASAAARVIATHIELTRFDVGAALDQFLERLPLPRGSQVLIVDSTGRQQRPPWRAGVVGSLDMLDMTDASAPVSDRDWRVRVGVPYRVAWERAGPNARMTIVISGVATVVLLLLQAAFLRRWLPALSSLERSTARVAAGDLGVPITAPMPSLELEHLRDAFRDMVEKLRAARESIAHQVEEERRMRRELESLQQQVIRQERLAAIGVLVSGIAHELNNPLQAISGSAELLRRVPHVPEAAQGELALIHQESSRAGAIIRNLSRFGRQQGATPGPVPMSDVLNSVIELRQRRLTDQGIRLERDERATRSAHAVFTELQQVVLNLIINAEQSMRACDPGARRLILRTFDEGQGVTLEIEDTGPGVSPEDETKLFQPFFTTKPVGEGTGLGLSVSYGIIRSAGGTIGYRRGALGGATFHFTVPASQPS
jgi:C4-dicarboxylate-specific signal transduction histidine kinase